MSILFLFYFCKIHISFVINQLIKKVWPKCCLLNQNIDEGINLSSLKALTKTIKLQLLVFNAIQCQSNITFPNRLSDLMLKHTVGLLNMHLMSFTHNEAYPLGFFQISWDSQLNVW